MGVKLVQPHYWSARHPCGTGKRTESGDISGSDVAAFGLSVVRGNAAAASHTAVQSEQFQPRSVLEVIENVDDEDG